MSQLPCFILPQSNTQGAEKVRLYSQLFSAGITERKLTIPPAPRAIVRSPAILPLHAKVAKLP